MDGYNRAKTSSAPTSANPATGIPPNKLTSIQNDDAKDKEGSVNGSEGGSDEGGASSPFSPVFLVHHKCLVFSLTLYLFSLNSPLQQWHPPSRRR
jgi:hypothetical protein